MKENVTLLESDIPKISRENYSTWSLRARELIIQMFGEQHRFIAQYDALQLGPISPSNSSRPYEAENNWLRAQQELARRKVDFIKGAIKTQSQLLPTQNWFDPDLWNHCKSLIEAEQWPQIPAIVETYFEDSVRKRAGNPTDNNGNALYGVNLMVEAFGDQRGLTLGSQPNENQGWMQIARGFVQACSNVDRHHNVVRANPRAYALGVLGTASLILTQIREKYPQP